MIKQRIKILFVHPSNELYGSDVVLLGLLQRLNREEFQPLVILPSDLPYEGRLSKALAESNIDYRILNIAILRRRYLSIKRIGFFLWHFLTSVISLARLINREKIEIVHVNTAAALCGALATRSIGVKVVWHIHEIITEPVWMRKLMSFIIGNYSDWIVAISEAVRNHLYQDIPRAGSKISIIYDAIDCEQFHPSNGGDLIRQEWGIDTNQVAIGIVGRISARKGQDVFVQAAQKIGNRFSEARFFIIGDPVKGEIYQLEQLETWIKENKLENIIHLVGFREDIPQIMDALDILVVPSIKSPEPFGLVALEGMASGIPVVATQAGGLLEIVEEGITGLFFPEGDVDALADRLTSLLQSPQLRAAMGEAGRKRVQQLFSFNPHINQFESLYYSLKTME